jgi:hypothetical protein
MGTAAWPLVTLRRVPEDRALVVLALRRAAGVTAFFLVFFTLADEADDEFVWALAGLTWLANTTAKPAATIKDDARINARDKEGKGAIFSSIESRVVVLGQFRF